MDMMMVTLGFLLGYAAIIPLAEKYPLYAILIWPSYWIAQGTLITSLWVIAHECGHEAFSNSKVINDVVGFIFHSALFVPYFSWKFTHGRHHSKTGHVDKDEVFRPSEKH